MPRARARHAGIAGLPFPRGRGVLSSLCQRSRSARYFQRLMPYGVVVPDDSSCKRLKFPRPAGNLDGPYMYVFHRMVLLVPLDYMAASRRSASMPI
jgi:hypothetical protein